MHIALFFALAAVYVLGVAGVVCSELILPGARDEVAPLDERLANIRAAESPIPGPRNRAS